jgi:hypothetical protein
MPLKGEDATVRIFVALLTAALWLWSLGSTQAQWDVFNNDAPQIKIEAAVLALDRSRDDNGIPLITNSLTFETLFDSGQATDLNTAAGVDISLQFWSHYGVEMEVEGGYAHWERSDSFLGPFLETPFLPQLSPDEINYQYDSKLFSVEWNCRREWTPGFTFLLGPRFVYLEEYVRTDTSTTIFQPLPLPVLEFETLTTVDTKNPLVGAQLGGELDVLLTGNIAFEGYIKAGAYANFSSAFVHQESTGFDDLDSDRTKSAGSFVGELGGRLYYYVHPGACSFFVGYEATWIDNVALAPVQFITFENLNNDVILGVTPFVGGAVFGLEFLR